MKQRYDNKMKDIEHDICENKVFEEIAKKVEKVEEKSVEIKEAKSKKVETILKNETKV